MAAGDPSGNLFHVTIVCFTAWANLEVLSELKGMERPTSEVLILFSHTLWEAG